MVVIDLRTKTETELSGNISIALGSFDGVHLGHRRVIEEAVKHASEKGVKSVVWCLGVGGKKTDGEFVTAKDEKIKLIASMGADYAAFEDFEKIKDLSPEEFVEGYLKDMGCVFVSVGFNFRFGKGASGDVQRLRALCHSLGIESTVVPSVEIGDTVVSSSVIRNLLKEGEMTQVSKLLGYDFFLFAGVIHGRSLGAKLGFPTVNQKFENGKIIPKHGVYFTLTETGGKTYPSVTNVGSRPTVGGHACRAETHIIGFDRDIYGENVTVYFKAFRRPEVCFGSGEELTAALKEDIKAAREYFSLS